MKMFIDPLHPQGCTEEIPARVSALLDEHGRPVVLEPARRCGALHLKVYERCVRCEINGRHGRMVRA